ncbi:hypothetical protein ACQP3L_31080, partial [Escherichia coli]
VLNPKIVFLISLILCVWVFCLHVCSHRGQEGTSDPLELESQTDVSCHVNAGNETRLSLEGQPVLLIAEPSLQPLLRLSFLNKASFVL